MEDDPVRSATAGVTDALLEWSEEKIKAAAKKLRDRKLAFIKSTENIELVKEERGSSEFSILKQFIPKGKYTILVQMGLALRDLHDLRRTACDQDRAMDLGYKIVGKYGMSGLHVARITHIGITSQLLTRLVGLYRDPEEVKKKLAYFFDNIEQLVIFVKRQDDPAAMAKVITTRIETLTTQMVIVFGSGLAKEVVFNILSEIQKDKRGYAIEKRDYGIQIVAFIFAPELQEGISHWSDAVYTGTGS